MDSAEQIRLHMVTSLMLTRIQPAQFFILAAVFMLALLTFSPLAFAQNADELAEDSETISACLKRENPDNRANCIGMVANPCLQLPEGQTTLGMANCHRREASVWDKRLNAQYKELMATLTPKAAKGLKNAQRAWIAFRNAYCDTVTLPFEGGSITKITSANCYMDLTA
ncbi:MAG: DUF1311 domain-containing protein, partial [Alphaproteobacteria bacterium]